MTRTAFIILSLLLSPAVAHAGDIASWYSHGKRTANGERFDPLGMTCAHRTLRFGTMLIVTFRGRSVMVRVNDRGPFIRGRTIDLSLGAAREIGLTAVGVGPVIISRS